MGLKAMGIADSIVNLAFGLTLGAVAGSLCLIIWSWWSKAAARFLRKMQDKWTKNALKQKKQSQRFSRTPQLTKSG